YPPPMTIEEMNSNEKMEKPFVSYTSYLLPEEDEQWEDDSLKNPTGSLTKIMAPFAKRSFSTPQSTSPLSNLIKSAESKTSQNPIFKLEIECSPNTPIEMVIDDIGRSLNSAAYLLDIERIKQGDFVLHEDTLEWEECTDFDNIYDSMNDWIRKARKRELERKLG
ncbi:385_t:CDS:1, partial [Acaulospora morrowiae]